MAKSDGSLIVLELGTDKIIGLTNNTLDFTADEIETTSKDSTGKWKEFIQGEKGGTISFEARYDDQEDTGEVNFNKLFEAFEDGTVISIMFGTGVTGDRVVNASAFLTALSWTAPQNDASGVTGSLRITGVPTIVTL
jgi:predicted secreted protein